MSIDLVIGGDHGKRAYREIIKLNERITPGRKTITIFKLAHIRYNKKNGEIINIRVVYPIRDRINHICARSFIGWTHKGKKHFITLPHCFPLSLPRAKKYEMQSGCVFLSIETYLSITFSLEKRGYTNIGALSTCCTNKNIETVGTRDVLKFALYSNRYYNQEKYIAN